MAFAPAQSPHSVISTTDMGVNNNVEDDWAALRTNDGLGCKVLLHVAVGVGVVRSRGPEVASRQSRLIPRKTGRDGAPVEEPDAANTVQ